ncbi:MAG TPA: ABC transporter ATP-binding protein [Chitinophagales bacterium]|nr:ABC transporter ATP-binding protein [Chitinophagales bacterium]
MNDMQHPAIEVHDLSVSYFRKPALWDIDFEIPGGVLAGILGPNGAGKSTLIKAIMGLIANDSGYIKMFGKDLETMRKRIAYVPQRGTVDWQFPASVIDVVLMGRYGIRGVLNRTSKEDKNFAIECLLKVGLQDYSKRQISQLSGGQQQRVFIARALAQEADLYFMDEPFAGIDAATEKTIFELLLTMRSENKTILVVHHDLQSAFTYFDWIILLNTQLVAHGPKEKIFTSEYLQKTYGGKLNLLTKVQDIFGELQIPVREKK